METAIGITASIGLSTNKFLAQIASDLNKARGFGCRAATLSAAKTGDLHLGVRAAMQARLARDGITVIADLTATSQAERKCPYGPEGLRLS